jgi:hypothetical protein
MKLFSCKGKVQKSPEQNRSYVPLILSDSLHATVYSEIAAVPSPEWDSLLGSGDIFLFRKYLSVVEASSLPGLQFRYVILKSGKKVRSILYFQLVNLSDEGLGGILDLEEYGGMAAGLSAKINNVLFNPGNGKKSFLLVCGNLLVSGNHGIRAVDSDAFTEAVASVSQLKKHFTFTSDKTSRIVAHMVKDYYTDEDNVAGPLLRKDYFILNTDPEMIFERQPEWKGFDDYLSALSSKYRVRANQSLSKMENIEVRTLSNEEIIERQEEIFELNCRVMKKAPVKLVKPTAAYFLNLKRVFGDQYRINGFFLNGNLIAFTSALWNQHHFEAHYIGIDYHFNKEYAIYQNILYIYIRDFIECGSARLFFGRTALEIKSAAGARPHHLACYFRFSNRIVNTLAKPLVSSTGPGNWVPRDPFRK